ncbi:hypothetical protein HUG10_13135 [Halorarum halophilum]|uniref:Uncharacterized protein n=1 Tax=Halorarum halophilum TaxID=2743090 RepID=A0A7D5H1B3_9EURY|nr:hypothetical protein [Halobaculum halophilum]QLG28433.1 hypothetical protein HUG10_13135 [Halobaculum halophilum]
MGTDRERKMESRTIEGTETLVNVKVGEIFIDIPAASARYIRVREGDVVREGDIRARAEEELESPSLGKWTIETIGPETVIGTDQETGERREWERKTLEQQLATGGLSTNLTDFERVNVTDRKGEEAEERSVVAVVYGNDGRKFTRTFRPVDGEADGDERQLEPTDADERVEEFGAELRERFDRAVELALRNEGYAI